MLCGQDEFNIFLTDVQMPGMSGHVTKPVDIDILVAAILGLLTPRLTPTGASLPLTATPSDAPHAADPDSDAPVDWAVLEKRMVCPKILRKTLESMVLHHTGTPADLRRLMAGTDPEPVRLIAHNLRGVDGLAKAMDVLLAEVGAYLSTLETRNISPLTAMQGLTVRAPENAGRPLGS